MIIRGWKEMVCPALNDSSLEKPALQKRLHITTPIHDKKYADNIIDDSVNNTIRLEKNLPVFLNPDIE